MTDYEYPVNQHDLSGQEVLYVPVEVTERATCVDIAAQYAIKQLQETCSPIENAIEEEQDDNKDPDRQKRLIMAREAVEEFFELIDPEHSQDETTAQIFNLPNRVTTTEGEKIDNEQLGEVVDLNAKRVERTGLSHYDYAYGEESEAEIVSNALLGLPSNATLDAGLILVRNEAEQSAHLFEDDKVAHINHFFLCLNDMEWLRVEKFVDASSQATKTVCTKYIVSIDGVSKTQDNGKSYQELERSERQKLLKDIMTYRDFVLKEIYHQK